MPLAPEARVVLLQDPPVAVRVGERLPAPWRRRRGYPPARIRRVSCAARPWNPTWRSRGVVASWPPAPRCQRLAGGEHGPDPVDTVRITHDQRYPGASRAALAGAAGPSDLAGAGSRAQ